MSVIHDSFTSSSFLKDFCEEYVKLSEELIMWDEKFMELIDSTEKEAQACMIAGVKTNFASETEMHLHFMRLRVRKIALTIEGFPGAKKRQKDITNYLSKHKNEARMLKLNDNNGELLTPTQIYANYYCVANQLKSIEAYLNSRNKKK